MPTTFDVFATTVSDGIVQADSTVVTIAVYAPDETIDTNDGADIRVVDTDGDGLISPAEWNDGTSDNTPGDTGQGQNGGVSFAIYDNDTNSLNGTLYSSNSYTATTDGNGVLDNDITTFLNSMPSNFDPIDLGGLVVCFTKGTLIKTRNGDVAVENLAIGDEVLTADDTFKTIRWAGGRNVSAADLAANPKLRPIRILAGALGNGMPKRDMLVSRQHRMVLSSPIAKRMFNGDVLVSAIKLTGLPGIFVDNAVESVEYFHVLFDKHEIVFAEGAASESLYTGPEALKAVSPKARKEILTLFPELANKEYKAESAMMIPTLKQQKELVAQHSALK